MRMAEVKIGIGRGVPRPYVRLWGRKGDLVAREREDVALVGEILRRPAAWPGSPRSSRNPTNNGLAFSDSG